MWKTESVSSNTSNGNETLLLDSLLDDIYNHHGSFAADFAGHTTTNESDNTLTAASSSTFDADRSYAARRLYNANLLTQKSLDELRDIRFNLAADVTQVSGKLVRLLKQRDITNRKVEQLANILTAVLQATSAKTAADAKLSFTLAASPGESGWQKWVDAMRAISRLPGGIPDHFRRKLWVGLADNYLASNRIDWNAVSRTGFNDKSNPDDSALGLQIVKDLHRTGCSNSFLPPDADVDSERTLLKRVLLAYARWNKQVGYCQGFNVLATVILDTVDRSEADALKVMIYLIDHVLPANYYSNCLRLLAVDLAVFRHLLTANLPQLAQHLDKLQKKATTADDGIFYEPPLTNVFLMQWLLTLYATCLPKHALLRFWDCLLLNGSDVLLSAGLHIFSKLSKHILACSTVDQYYTSMEKNVKSILRESKTGSVAEADAFIQAIYKPLTPSVGELREQFLYSIQPFLAPTTFSSGSTGSFGQGLDGQKEGPATLFGCFSSMCGRSLQNQESYKGNNDTYVNGIADEQQLREIGAVRERMTTDLKKLKRNYDRLAKKRSSAIVVFPSAVGNDCDTPSDPSWNQSSVLKQLGRSLSTNGSPTGPTPPQPCFLAPGFGVINHLLVSKSGLEEVNQRIVSLPLLEMVLPPSMPSTVSTSPCPPSSPPFARRRFLPNQMSTATKCPPLNEDTGLGSTLNETSICHDQSLLTGLALDPSSSLTTERPVLSSLPTSPDLKQKQPESCQSSDLVEIDISSECDYTGNYVEDEDEQQQAPTTGSSESEKYASSKQSSYMDNFSSSFSQAIQPGQEANENSSPSTKSLASSTYYYAAAKSNHLQQIAMGRSTLSASTHSPFPISTAARLKQRLHLIPGVTARAAAVGK